MTWSICESELRRSILPANGREREREKKSHGEKESDIALMRYVQATKKRAGEGRKVHFGYSSKDMRGGQRKEGGGKRRRRNAKRKVVFMCGNPHRSLTMRAHRYDARLSLSVTKEHIGASSKEHALGIKEHWRKPASQPALVVVVVVVVLEEPLLLQCISRRGQHISGHLQEAKEMPQQQKRSDC